MMEIEKLLKNLPDKIIDCSAWVGDWPFYYLRYGDIDLLGERYEKYNIGKVYVSPIEAILETEPKRPNQLLFDRVDRFNDRDGKVKFMPVPVLDLSIKNWEDLLFSSMKRSDVKMIKLLPNYHMYDFNEEILEKLVGITSQEKILISVQIRVEDPRRHHPLMKVGDVDINTIAKTVSHFPRQKFLINNGSIREIGEGLYFPTNVWADMANAEIQDVITHLVSENNPDRILFSTHSAFYFPEASVFKLALSDSAGEIIEKVAFRNGEAIGL